MHSIACNIEYYAARSAGPLPHVQAKPVQTHLRRGAQDDGAMPLACTQPHARAIIAIAIGIGGLHSAAAGGADPQPAAAAAGVAMPPAGGASQSRPMRPHFLSARGRIGVYIGAHMVSTKGPPVCCCCPQMAICIGTSPAMSTAGPIEQAHATARALPGGPHRGRCPCGC